MYGMAWELEARRLDRDIQARAAAAAYGRPRALQGGIDAARAGPPRATPEAGPDGRQTPSPHAAGPHRVRTLLALLALGVAIGLGTLAGQWWGEPATGSARPAAGDPTASSPAATDLPSPPDGFLGGFEARATGVVAEASAPVSMRESGSPPRSIAPDAASGSTTRGAYTPCPFFTWRRGSLALEARATVPCVIWTGT